MEQTFNNIEHNMTDKIIEELVNHIEDTVEEEVKQEEVKQEEVKQEEVIRIENTTNNEINVEETKQVKPRTNAKPKSKPKTQNDTDTQLTKAEMNEFADINNEFQTLLKSIDKMPNLKDKFANELLNKKKTHIKVNDEIMNLKDSSYIVAEVICSVLNCLAKIRSNKSKIIYFPRI